MRFSGGCVVEHLKRLAEIAERLKIKDGEPVGIFYTDPCGDEYIIDYTPL